MATPYSRLLERIARGGGTASLEIPDDWMQGRSVFGGLQAAIGVAAMRTLVPDLPLRTLQVTFLAPVPQGVVDADARVLRTGKNVSTIEARIGGDAAGTLLVGTFGAPRDSKVRVLPTQEPISGDRSIALPFIPGVVPSFLQHFAARWRTGAPPFSGRDDTQAVVDIDLRDDGTASEAHVFAIADFMPPLALTHLTAPVPGSTATWMLELLADRFDELPLAGWRADATLVAARDGYLNQSVMLWGPGGVPVAIGRQTMLVFG